MKRGRNQRRRQGMNINRALDSNGPDVRIRGTANQIYDKYLALARDSSSSGDRIKAENYLQHAEHYFRVIRSIQPPQPVQNEFNDGAEGDQPTLGDNGEDQRRPENGAVEQTHETHGPGDMSEEAEGSPEAPRSGEARNFEPRNAEFRNSGPRNAEQRNFGNGSGDFNGAPSDHSGDPRRGRRRRPRRPHQGESGSDTPEVDRGNDDPAETGSN
ncbi:MAG: DUF4167 domain-containing protein [Parvularculaceae bacterium]